MLKQIKEILIVPNCEQWLAVAPKCIVEYRKKWIKRILSLSIISIIIILIFPSMVTLPFLFVLTPLFFYISLNRFWLLRCYEYLSNEDFRIIEDYETDKLKNLLLPISKAQGFLMQGQLEAAKQKLREDKDRQTMFQWK